MRLIQIQYFLTIAEKKSFTEASRQLYVSQPALSKQMNLLEEELGVRLINRMPRGIALTPAGAQFANDLKKIMAELDDAVRRVSDTSQLKVLRIGCFDGAVIEDFMPDLLQSLQNIAPELQIRLTRHTTRKNRENLRNDEIDMAIEIHFLNEDQPVHAEYCEKALIRRKGALIYSVNSPLAKISPLTPADFAKETFLTPNQQEDMHLASHGIRVLKALGIQNPKIETIDNLMSIITYIKLGLGYSVLAEAAAKYTPGLLAYPLPDELGIDVVAIWKKSSRQITDLMEHLPAST